MLAFLSFGLFAEDYYSESVYSISDDGDTLTINPYNYGGPVNSVYYAIMYDTASDGSRNNESRVYKTIRGGVYIYNGPAVIDASVADLKIVAEDYNSSNQPPLHIKVAADDGGTNRDFFQYYGNFYAQNQYFCMAYSATTTRDRLGFEPKGTDQTMEMDNCIFELSDWTIFSNWASGISFKFTNCKFLNIGREASIEKGVPFDGGSSIRELYLENNTFLNCGFVVWTRESAGVGTLYANHNTFVNMTQNPFQTYTQAEEVVTNNLFINTGLVPDYPGYYASMEEDDALPRGIINIDTVEAAMKTDYFEGQFDYPVDNEADRAVLVDRNNAWWDSKFTTMFESGLEDCSSYYADGWMDQKITMNSRTEAMFDDDASYPLFTEGTWFSAEPDFTDNEDLIDDWVNYIVTNAKANPEEVNTGDVMPNWRTNTDTLLTTIDWPILADLSYTTSDLVSGGLNGYPLGDLNWFPSYKSQWDATAESDTLLACRDAGRIPSDWAKVSGVVGTSSSSRDVAVYPNPTSASATIEFNLVAAGTVEFCVYNISGERVMTETGIFSSGINEYNLDTQNLESGMYIIQLNTSYNTAGLITKLQIIK